VRAKGGIKNKRSHVQKAGNKERKAQAMNTTTKRRKGVMKGKRKWEMETGNLGRKDWCRILVG